MAQLHSRANLSAARFPLVTSFQGRTIVLSQYDQNFQKSAVFAGADADRDVGIPQIFYCHNVIPSENGIQSVGYTPVISAASPAQTDFDQAIKLLDPDGNKFILVPAAGKNYVFDAPVLEWASVSPISGLASNILVTTAYVNGQSYVFYEGNGCYQYNNVTKTFDAVVLTGLIAANLKGIVGSNGYLIAWDSTTIYWSSAADPLDFTPSLLTGAGSSNVTDLKGAIVCCLPSISGFIIYSTGNAVGASFTANIRFPFTFKEVPGSGGIRSKEHISYEDNLEDHYAITSAGLQTINKSGSKVIFAEVIDFLTSRIFEDFDDTTNLFTISYPTSDLSYKLTVVASRYLVISYGIASGIFTHALCYDILLKRWGKFKITHTDCFEYPYPNLYGEITYEMLLSIGDLYSDLYETTYAQLFTTQVSSEKPRRTIAFLQQDGTVQLANFDLGALDNNGVLLLGKYQFNRGHACTMLGCEVETMDEGTNFEAILLPSFDGKNFQAPVVAFLKDAVGQLRRYLCRKSGQNHTWLYKGSFNMVSVLVHYTQHGFR